MDSKTLPPELCSIAQCDRSLDFLPLSHWPQALPAMAVNKLVFAGFSQKLALNHEIRSSETSGEEISQIFHSLYSELSFVEIARLIRSAQALENHSWFPLSEIIQKFQWQPTDSFFSIASHLLKMPLGFQNWCAERKMGPLDLAPLVSAAALNLKPLLKEILELQLSKSLGSQALELSVELQLMGISFEKFSLEALLSPECRQMHTKAQGELWVENLKRMRSPETLTSEQADQHKMTSLPWPCTSEARWIRQGNRNGIELKIFVSQPSDLETHLQSLAHIQDLMEKDFSGTKH